jgi:hypothetical protein
MKIVIIGIAASMALFSCTKKSSDSPQPTPPPNENFAPEEYVQVRWGNSFFYDAVGKEIIVESSKLDSKSIGFAVPLSVDTVAHQSPVFLARQESIPFLVFVKESGASIAVRNTKKVGGVVVKSQTINPSPCPDNFTLSKPPVFSREVPSFDTMCIPFISSVIPEILNVSDAGRNVSHEFSIIASSSTHKAATLSVVIDVTLAVPKSSMNVSVSKELSKMTLSRRFDPVFNSAGEPRNDFPLFDLRSSKSPGVNSSWIVCIPADPKDRLQLSIESEVFYEQPVIKIPGSEDIRVARGASFRKRAIRLDSISQLTLALRDSSGNMYKAPETPGECVTIPITDGSRPFEYSIIANFQQLKQAGRPLSDFIQPLSPSYCRDQEATFQYHLWRKNSEGAEFIACDAVGRNTYSLFKDKGPKVTSPTESFFGSFNYLARSFGSTLGGTEGVFSVKYSISGKLRLAVKDPIDGIRELELTNGFAPLSLSYSPPSVISEFDSMIQSGKAPSGLQLIRDALVIQGFTESSVPGAFPFGPRKDTRSDILH